MPTETPTTAPTPEAPKAAPTAAVPATAPPDTPATSATDAQEKERRRALRDLGIRAPKSTPTSQVIAEELSRAEKRREELRQAKDARVVAEAKAADLEKQVAAVKALADVELGMLDEKARELVKQLAGDDPADQLRQIAAVKAIAGSKAPAAPASEASAPPPPPAAPPATPPAKLAAPANTAPPAAPAPAGPATELPVKERYAQLRTISDPTQREAVRAMFLLKHGGDLLRAI